MIKLNAGISRKVGEANYGSRGASVNVELELDSAVAANPQQLFEHVRRLFGMARAAVDEELGISAKGGTSAPPSRPAASSPAPPTQPVATNGNGAAARPATAAQVRAIRALCDKLHLDPQQEVAKRFKGTMEGLVLADASALIDELKKAANGH